MNHEDDLERTQRLPIVEGVCNCPIRPMIVHVVGCPLRYVFEVNGRPLSELGLEGAVVVHPDGHTEPLIGIYFHQWDSTESLLANLQAAFGDQYPGCKLVFGL